jgi:pimeloyl-ACP methyl ester carboxylesterase
MITAYPKEGTFQSEGRNMHYLDWGDSSSTPMILLHHVSSQAHTWDSFARRMCQDYRVIALDMRGHGDSEWAGTGNYTTEHYASDVKALVDNLGLQRVIVLGGSLGGRVALVYAAQNPDKAAALIMEDVGAVRPQSIAQGFADRIAAGDPILDTVADWQKQFRGNNTRTPPEYSLSAAVHATKQLPDGRRTLKRDPAIQLDFVPMELWGYVEALKAPLLLLIGSESQIVGEDQQTKFKELKPDIEMVTIQGAGHQIVHDKLDEFESTIRSFLRKNGL